MLYFYAKERGFMEKKSKIKKVITSLLAVSVSVGAVLGATKAFNFFKDNGLLNPNEQHNLVLDDVKNVSFDEKTSLLSWDSVENADSYVTSVNGEEYTVETNYMFYLPVENETEFKVKAVDSTGKYKESNWSDVYTYSVSKDEVTYSSVYGFVDGMLQGSDKVQKILSMEINNGYLYTKASFLDRKGNPKLYYLQTDIGNFKELSEIIKNQDQCFTRTYRSFDLCEQNAMEYLVKSNSFDGKLEEYRQQGYEISVVSSATGLRDNYASLQIDATLKLQKGNDTKYVTISLSAFVKNPTGNPKIDYTVKLADPEQRSMNTSNFVILSGDLAKFAEEMDRVNNMQNETSAETYNVQSVYDFNGLEA